MLNDDAIGRVLDRIYEYGTWKIFSEICVQAFRSFGVDCSVVHHDTTSVSVWGEYESSGKEPLHITHGFSKDKRPDLKQFVLSLLCVEGNLPCHGGALSGNAPDKKINGNVLNELPRIMANHGQKDFIYVADSALATEENLSLMRDDIRFITRLPANFGACGQLIREAVSSGAWIDAGQLSHRTVKGKEICAHYRLHETRVELCGRTYRAIVVHSDAHDRRRQKRIDRAIEKDALAVKERAWNLSCKEFFCLADAQATAKAFKGGDFHEVSCSVAIRPTYGKGRPSKNRVRPIKDIRFRIAAKVEENKEAVEKLREEAGCFVLLTSVPTEEKKGVDILRLYKEQDGIERNFAFLKDPLVVNDVFLKTPRRIEAMGPRPGPLPFALAPHGADDETEGEGRAYRAQGLEQWRDAQANLFHDGVQVLAGLRRREGRQTIPLYAAGQGAACLSEGSGCSPLHFHGDCSGKQGRSFQGAVMRRETKIGLLEHGRVRNIGCIHQQPRN